MLRNITRRHAVVTELHELRFFTDETGGYAFPCDQHGNLLELEPAALATSTWGREHPERVPAAWNELYSWEDTYIEPGRGTCICGREVVLWDEYMGACECECGRWYNVYGQELIDPRYWEEGNDW